VLLVAGVLIPATAAAISFSCTAALGTPAFTAGPLKILGTVPVGAELSLQAGHAYLIEVQERDNDALVEILGAESKVIAQADHPERRTGTRRLIVTAPELHALTVRITGKEHANAAGTATVQAFDLAALSSRPDCLFIEKTLVVADTDYAKATSTDSRARDAFLHLADEYSTAERALTSPADRPLRGQTALALAEIEYLYLEDWTKTLEWARTASENLEADPYRRARADSLQAGALIQIGSSADPKAILGQGLSSAMLLSRARTEAQRLSRFHQQRGERYDAALQMTNIGLTYYYEGRYAQCAVAALSAGRLFDKIGEIQRRAQSWQNRALCLWGSGHLPEALQWFERARGDIGPQPYPSFYLTVVNNTALADYALGHFDEALLSFGEALGFAEKIQWQRFAAQSLYGYGVTYYAIGDRALARDSLEKALAIRRKENVDGRGLMATLRALATIDADEGRVQEAIAADQEALNLAVDPSAIETIMVQLAVHTAAAGDPAAAKVQLDKVIAKGPGADPLIQAQAQLERAVLLREMGRPREALADLAAARPQLHRGNLAAAFRADLELARTLRVVGEPRAAFAAVEKALAQSEAIRLQSANPELRSQLQIPLRAAYDLKIELLRARFELASAAGREAEASALASAAFATADAARAHSFADVASQRYAPAIRIALAPEFRHREELYRELAGRRFALDLILDGSGSRDPRARRLMGDIAELERQVDSVNTLIAVRASTAERTSPTQRLGVPQLPVGTTLISYWLGSESAYAWVVSSAGIHWVQLPPPAAIADSAAAFHDSLRRLADVLPEKRLQQAQGLYELIIRPIELWLSSTGQWIVIPDGALAYVPFAALRDADDKAEPFVAMRHYVALAPAAWMLNTGGRGEQTDKGRLLLVADPVYQADDPRLATAKKPPAGGADAPRGGKAADRADSLKDYQRLPFTAQEAARIVAQFPPADVDQLIGVNATRERLLALDWSKYRFIHIATHGTVDAQVPQLSALILGSYDAHGNRVDGAVRVADLSLQTLNADVAVFSACDTALGKEVPGEGLVGIGSTVLARGARAVVASLWPVSDEIGARLMTEFYGHLLHDSMSVPAALGESMRSAIKSPGSADPALWAAFQVSVVALGPGLPSGNAGVQTVAGTNGPKEMP
jgi:CHAT domain-containing protein/tetratricopeptide (TPR) repeat protein